jgi:hypothetical protein
MSEAQIRIPKTAERYLKLVSSAGPVAGSRLLFKTNAQLIMFAASMGFYEDRFDEHPQFNTGAPYPVDMQIFKNIRLYPYLQVLAMAKSGNHEAALDDEVIARTVEGYASAGFSGSMIAWYEQGSGKGELILQDMAAFIGNKIKIKGIDHV